MVTLHDTAVEAAPTRSVPVIGAIDQAPEPQRRAAEVLALAVPNRGWGWYLRTVQQLHDDPTPAETRTPLEQAILDAWRAGENAQIARDAIRRRDANLAQQQRVRQQNALHGAAEQLRARHPERSEVDCLLDAALVVAAYQKLRSEIGPVGRREDATC